MLGGAPLLEKRKTFVGITLEAAIEKFLVLKLDEFRNEKHCKQWRSTLGAYAKPVLGRKQESEISVQDVLRVLQPIWHIKTETAKRLRGRIENVL